MVIKRSEEQVANNQNSRITTEVVEGEIRGERLQEVKRRTNYRNKGKKQTESGFE